MTIEHRREAPQPAPKQRLQGVTITHDNGHKVMAFMRPDGVGLDESMPRTDAYTAFDLSTEEAFALADALKELAGQALRGC